jgi:hypothetical protein
MWGMGLLFISGAAISLTSFGGTYTVALIPPPSGFTNVAFYGLNTFGQAAGSGYNGTSFQAIIGSPSGSSPIPFIAGWTNTVSFALNDSGQVVGYGNNGTTTQAFIGTVSGSIPIPLPSGWFASSGNAINNSGQVAGGGGTNISPYFSQPYIATPAGSMAIPLPPGWTGNVVGGINNIGQVAGVAYNGATTQAYIGTTSGIVPIPLLPGWSDLAYYASINDPGQLVGYAENPQYQDQVFIGTPAGTMAIPLPSGAYGAVLGYQAINNQGVVVGGSNVGPWIWDATNGTRLLSTLLSAAWAVTGAPSINNNGQILVEGFYQVQGPGQYVELTPCTYSLSSTIYSPGVAAASSSVTVICPSGCDWTAVSNASWLTITSGASATGNGTVNFIVAANPGAARVGTLTIAGQTFTVNQAGLPSPPVLGSPTNGAVAVSLAPALMWSSSSGGTSYDVYFGPSPTPPFAVNTTATSYNPGTLATDTTYYWQIVARNSSGTSTLPVWSFTTQRLTGGPVIPTIDFNGDGKQDVFPYDPVAGTGYAGLSNGSGAFTFVYNAFTPGFDAIRLGNFNNDGFSDLVAYNSTSALGYVLLGNGSGTFSPVSLFWGPGFTRVAAGDLNGDGLTDFVIYRPTDGTTYTAISNGDGTFRYQYTLVSIGFTHMVVADFNGDGKADVFFYRSTDGLAFLGISSGTGGFTFSPVTLGAGYAFVESGDINGDGQADLLLYSSSSGATAVGLSNGSAFAFTAYSYSPGFTTAKLFDFNGDGLADVAFYNMNNTLGYLGVSNGTGFTFSSLFWGAGTTTVDALDLNGDGKIDIVIYNSANGASYTGISSGNAANPFTYQYSYWGNGKVLATTAAQP